MLFLTQISGTVRSYDAEVRNLAERSIIKIATSVAEANDAKAEVTYNRGYDAIYNHPEETKIVMNALENVPGVNNVLETPPLMVSEDFCYYTQKVPGSFFNTGAQMENPTEMYPHHHPKFDFDERALATTAKSFCSIILSYQKQHSKHLHTKVETL